MASDDLASTSEEDINSSRCVWQNSETVHCSFCLVLELILSSMCKLGVRNQAWMWGTNIRQTAQPASHPV